MALEKLAQDKKLTFEERLTQPLKLQRVDTVETAAQIPATQAADTNLTFEERLTRPVPALDRGDTA